MQTHSHFLKICAAEAKIGGDERAQRELEAHRQTYPFSFFTLTQDGWRMYWSIEVNVSHNNLSIMVSCKHMISALSSTRLQSIGRGRKPGEPYRSSPATLGPVAPEDPGARIASPGAVLTCEHVERTPGVITQSGSCPICLDADST
jgi:hypothetical protein